MIIANRALLVNQIYVAFLQQISQPQGQTLYSHSTGSIGVGSLWPSHHCHPLPQTSRGKSPTWHCGWILQTTCDDPCWQDQTPRRGGCVMLNGSCCFLCFNNKDIIAGCDLLVNLLNITKFQGKKRQFLIPGQVDVALFWWVGRMGSKPPCPMRIKQSVSSESFDCAKDFNLGTGSVCFPTKMAGVHKLYKPHAWISQHYIASGAGSYIVFGSWFSNQHTPLEPFMSVVSLGKFFWLKLHSLPLASMRYTSAMALVNCRWFAWAAA